MHVIHPVVGAQVSRRHTRDLVKFRNVLPSGQTAFNRITRQAVFPQVSIQPEVVGGVGEKTHHGSVPGHQMFPEAGLQIRLED